VFAADLVFAAARRPRVGETLKGDGFEIGPGGKGSNQAVAASRSGAQTNLLTRLGRDAFGDMARTLCARDGVSATVVEYDVPTGGAFVYVNSDTSENAIIIVPGTAASLSVADVEAAVPVIKGSQELRHFPDAVRTPETGGRGQSGLYTHFVSDHPNLTSGGSGSKSSVSRVCWSDEGSGSSPTIFHQACP
jgi:sugar/nucleoside kinase (ribokinase family)